MIHQSFKKGTIILWSMLLMAGMMTIGVAVSVIIIGSLRSAQEIDNSMTAFYATDACMEDTLWRRYQGDLAGGGIIDDVRVSTLNNTINPTNFFESSSTITWKRKSVMDGVLTATCIGKFESAAQAIMASF